LVTAKESRMLKRRRLTVAAGAALVCILGVVAFHVWVMDLDLFWIKLMRKVVLVLGT
jgi:polysaccharide biosynthesis transport protein